MPSLLKKTFAVIKLDLYKVHGKHKTVVKECFIKSSEFTITDKLNNLVKKYQDSATFGSYPEWTHSYYETKLTVESESESIADTIVREIEESMDVIPYDKCPEVNSTNKIATLLEKNKVKFTECFLI